MTDTLAVIDIDGTVADGRHRVHILAGTPTHDDWVAFFEQAGADTVIPEGAERARMLAQEHEVVWLTGRPERVRELTERWLADHDLPPGRLIMQPSDDRRPARVVKLERLRELSTTNDIAVVVDDDPRVIELATGAGFPCELAAWLPWTPVLSDPGCR
ncbi:hypothetical protein [Yinghuangia sp. YIM S10712]|uniref:phosphatase domain-containing protein n=1 Tax=Yinghuangia sp. YIM S10712 TaxID=3436930 RepID=UPI003F534F16